MLHNFHYPELQITACSSHNGHHQSVHTQGMRERKGMHESGPSYLALRNRSGQQPPWKTVRSVLKKQKQSYHMTWQPHPWTCRPRKITIWKDTCTPKFTAAPQATASEQQLPGQTPGEDDVVSLYHGTGLSQENELLALAATWMDLEMIMLTEASETGNNRTSMTSIRGGI